MRLSILIEQLIIGSMQAGRLSCLVAWGTVRFHPAELVYLVHLVVYLLHSQTIQLQCYLCDSGSEEQQ